MKQLSMDHRKTLLAAAGLRECLEQQLLQDVQQPGLSSAVADLGRGTIQFIERICQALEEERIRISEHLDGVVASSKVNRNPYLRPVLYVLGKVYYVLSL